MTALRPAHRSDSATADPAGADRPRADAPALGEDEAWVERIRAGDETAYEQLFRKYYRPLCEFAVAYVRSPHRAEEVVQDVLGAVWATRAAWQVRGTARRYLFGAVRNRGLNALARDRTTRAVFDAGQDAIDGTDVADNHPDAQAVLESTEMSAALDRAIASLAPGRRAVLTLRVRQEMSYAEIAATLGTSVKNVEVQLRRAVAALKVALPHYLD